MKRRKLNAGLMTWVTFGGIHGVVLGGWLYGPGPPVPLKAMSIGLFVGGAVGIAIYVLIVAIKRRPP